MSLELKLTSLFFLIFINFIIIYLVSKNKISVKYSIIWLIPSFILLVFIVTPNLLMYITKFFGFQTSSNMIFALIIALILMIIISLTVIVSQQKSQIRRLIQEISLIKGSNYDSK